MGQHIAGKRRILDLSRLNRILTTLAGLSPLQSHSPLAGRCVHGVRRRRIPYRGQLPAKMVWAAFRHGEHGAGRWTGPDWRGGSARGRGAAGRIRGVLRHVLIPPSQEFDEIPGCQRQRARSELAALGAPKPEPKAFVRFAVMATRQGIKIWEQPGLTMYLKGRPPSSEEPRLPLHSEPGPGETHQPDAGRPGR